MLTFKFKNYEDFKRIFVRECVRDGKAVREIKNKALLAALKSGIADFRSMTNEQELLAFCKEKLAQRPAFTYSNVELGEGCYFWSSKYYTDDWHGVCEDGDILSIRYRRQDNDKVYKMRAGKFFRHLVEDNSFCKNLPEQVKVLMCEHYALQWRTHRENAENAGAYELVVDDDFKSIYDERKTGYVGSCMSDKGQWTFYRDAINASAASLRLRETGEILARCILYNEVYDEEDKEYRLAERIYAREERFKPVLLSCLIKEKKIDGYKKLTASCHDAREFESVLGESWNEKSFHITMKLYEGDTLSYQDTFKYYDYENKVAYNNYNESHTDDLDTTDGTFDYEESYVWSEYLNEDILEEDAVWSELYQSELDRSYSSVIYDSDLQDWIVDDDNSYNYWVYSNYDERRYETNDVIYIQELDDYIHIDNTEYSEVYERRIPSEEICRDLDDIYAWSDFHQEYLIKAESLYSEILDDWFVDDCDVEEMENEEILQSIAI